MGGIFRTWGVLRRQKHDALSPRQKITLEDNRWGESARRLRNPEPRYKKAGTDPALTRDHIALGQKHIIGKLEKMILKLMEKKNFKGAKSLKK